MANVRSQDPITDGALAGKEYLEITLPVKTPLHENREVAPGKQFPALSKT